YYNFRNSLILLLKNERASKLLWLFPLRLVLDGVAGLQMLAGGKFKETITIIKAHFHFYGSLGKWFRRRREAQKLVTHRNETGIYPKSIVWDFFALRKKTFPKLGYKPKPLN